MSLVDVQGKPLVTPRRREAAQATAFEAGATGRRLRAIPTVQRAINQQIRAYGASVVARSRYLSSNNPYAAAAKDAFVSSMVGDGITPAPLIDDRTIRDELKNVWYDWTDEADADWLTDMYGLQAVVASEMFEAGECFVRFRTRMPEDGLLVPLQLQLLPSEMLPLSKNETLDNGRRIECGIEFDGLGRRVAYHFLEVHPGSDQSFGRAQGRTIAVPAEEVIHCYRPIRAGQIRGLPHTLAGITTLALLDLYNDAELERKRIAALFGAFVTRPVGEEVDPVVGTSVPIPASPTQAAISAPSLEPGVTIALAPGEDIKFAEPADVGATYEPFQYRNLLMAAAGFGVPYAEMTGDLKQANYGSIRAGLVTFRRKITAMQHGVMVYQLCRRVWNRWLMEAVLAGTLQTVTPLMYKQRFRDLQRVRWQPPAWEWIDPQKDIAAEVLAVQNHLKARSMVIEQQGFDPIEVDETIKADEERLPPPQTLSAGNPGAPPNEP